MRENTSVRRRKRKSKSKSKINYGVVIFGVIVIYILISFITFQIKPKVSIYEVSKSSLSSEKELTGIIVREEEVFNASKSGFVNYYYREGAKVAKDMVVYTIDEKKQVHDQLSDTGNHMDFTKKDTTEIKRAIDKYRKNYDLNDYTLVYALRDDLSSRIQEIIDSNLLDQMQTITSGKASSKDFSASVAKKPGIITYYSDNYDGLKEDGITAQIFNKDNYQKQNLRSSEIIEKGAPVYKLFQTNEWKIVCQIDEETQKKLSEKKSLSFVIEEDQTKVTAPIEVVKENDGWYLRISMSRYLLNYSSERFLTLTFDLDSQNGLKIPKTAVLTKEFYMIPKEFFTKGGDSNQMGLMADVYDEEKKEMHSVFLPCDIYCSDDTYYYVDESTLSYNTKITNVKTGEKHQVTMVGQLKGVYNLNKGFALFRQIEVIKEGSDYLIVKEGTFKGLSVYDHIALDASLIKENAAIY